ncbi:hypothetical protein D6779_05645 [Candidatus Parcubacteria bacterium]|nr:MAG: hypothetical protein D6779_05645 [Candidatus Parcubacteria bacterium]
MRRLKKLKNHLILFASGVPKRMVNRKAPAFPIYIFHHIPKCGGASTLRILSHWFIMIGDNRIGWSARYPEPVDLKRLNSAYCLYGHFDLDGYHLFERYPEVVGNPDFRLITFLRDPLSVKLSLYRYEREHGRTSMTLEEHLFKNYLANIFPVTNENYEEVLDQYFFVGVTESLPECMHYLAGVLNKKCPNIPVLNRTNTDSRQFASLTSEIVKRFRSENSLDYAIYDYACRRMRETLSLAGVNTTS